MEVNSGSKLISKSHVHKPQLALDEKRGMIPTILADSYLKDISNFKVRNDDIFVVSYPKSGTNWILYTLHLLNQLQKNEKVIQQMSPVPYMEFPEGYDVAKAASTPGQYVRANDMPSPRVLMSHLQLELLPRELRARKGKLIYIARNPKDVAVSFYHFASLTTNLPGYSWPEYFTKYCQGKTHRGLWFDHVLAFWEFAQGNEDTVLFLKYEDMILNPTSTVTIIAEFLGYSLTEDNIAFVVNQTSFENMKTACVPLNAGPTKTKNNNNKNKPSFMRKGKIGDWRNKFTVAQNEFFDAIYEGKMKNTGLHFDFGDQ
ncbi:sulfotransferase 1C2-like [Apostichopus japonicus]|uniref:sulfotransferase 1C2-like n=1 Tax=Stichopus japonicus TaxID=307972 RepID=UPI003AB283FA